MPVITLSAELVDDARTAAEFGNRSIPLQIEYWARFGRAALENPDLPARFLQDTMLSLEETKAGEVVAYRFG